VPIEKYKFIPNVSDDAPLIFLGRIERIKGVHAAIEVSKKTGRRLIIAGNHDEEGANFDYYHNEILPHCDGERIRYVGEVDDIQKNELLGKSAALLFPVEWDEPFGIVMPEALACGTPVIAYDKGAVSEVIENGVSGYVCNDKEEMVAAVGEIGNLNREVCRRIAKERFSADVITEKYVRLYETAISRAR